MWIIHTLKYYSTIKRNKILTHTTRMNLENTMLLSVRRQTQKVSCCRFHLYQVFRTGNVTKRKSRFVVAGEAQAGNE